MRRRLRQLFGHDGQPPARPPLRLQPRAAGGAATTAASSSGGAATTAAASGSATVSAADNSTIGQQILVNSAGMTVYLFEPDGTATTSAVPAGIKANWPPVVCRRHAGRG